jgi:hypothetical protein
MGTASIHEDVRRTRFSSLLDRTEAKELTQEAAAALRGINVRTSNVGRNALRRRAMTGWSTGAWAGDRLMEELLTGEVSEHLTGVEARSEVLLSQLIGSVDGESGGLSDIAVPDADFASLMLPAPRIFITENEINGLAFPDLPDSIVVFGLGYALDRLAAASWMADRAIHYWGDIDTHGFAMLDRLRAYFPRTRSLLMTNRRCWLIERYRSASNRPMADRSAG